MTLLRLGFLMTILTNSVNAQNNNTVIGNEFWKHESDCGVHFIMYYFSNEGSYIQYAPLY